MLDGSSVFSVTLKHLYHIIHMLLLLTMNGFSILLIKFPQNLDVVFKIPCTFSVQYITVCPALRTFSQFVRFFQYFSPFILEDIYRSSPSEVFWEKAVLKVCSKFTGEHPCRSAFSINLLHIFRTSLLKNTSGWLLLHLPHYSSALVVDFKYFFYLVVNFSETKQAVISS